MFTEEAFYFILEATSLNIFKLADILCEIPYFTRHLTWNVGRDSSVGIATHYGLDSPGIES